jgi:hypothetical protein
LVHQVVAQVCDFCSRSDLFGMRYLIGSQRSIVGLLRSPHRGPAELVGSGFFIN